MKRVNICVEQNTFKDISSVAKNENKTLFAFANEWLSEVAKISNEGWSPSRLDKLTRSVSLMKELDVVTLPSDFVDDLIAKQYASNKKELLKMLRELGTRIAGVVKFLAEDLKELADLANQYIELLPLKRFSIAIDRNGDVAEIVIVGAGRRIESTECALELLSSILESYGYAITCREMNVGTLRIWASKVSLPTH